MLIGIREAMLIQSTIVLSVECVQNKQSLVGAKNRCEDVQHNSIRYGHLGGP